MIFNSTSKESVTYHLKVDATKAASARQAAAEKCLIRVCGRQHQRFYFGGQTLQKTNRSMFLWI